MNSRSNRSTNFSSIEKSIHKGISESKKQQNLSFAERNKISVLQSRGESVLCIARILDRSPSTISRELNIYKEITNMVNMSVFKQIDYLRKIS